MKNSIYLLVSLVNMSIQDTEKFDFAFCVQLRLVLYRRFLFIVTTCCGPTDLTDSH
jgi:Mg2+/citrate symporter